MKAFYTEVLGQAVKADFGNCIMLECGLALWKLTEDYSIAKALGRTIHPLGNKNLEVYFETEDFEAEVVQIKQSGTKLLHDIKTETWGQKTIRFFDPEDNIVELGESIPCFCKRLHQEGMSAEQVADHTGVSLENVQSFL